MSRQLARRFTTAQVLCNNGTGPSSGTGPAFSRLYNFPGPRTPRTNESEDSEVRSTVPRDRQNSGVREMMAALSRVSTPQNPVNATNPDEIPPEELNRMQLRFVPGDIYAPNDLTMEELQQRRSNRRPLKDAFDVLGINPLTQYKNYNLLSDYITSMGRIQHSSQTGLRPVNQRRIAKAIRRAVGLGLLPSTHRHPEVLARQESSETARQLGQRPPQSRQW